MTVIWMGWRLPECLVGAEKRIISMCTEISNSKIVCSAWKAFHGPHLWQLFGRNYSWIFVILCVSNSLSHMSKTRGLALSISGFNDLCNVLLHSYMFLKLETFSEATCKFVCLVILTSNTSIFLSLSIRQPSSHQLNHGLPLLSLKLSQNWPIWFSNLRWSFLFWNDAPET